ncbi:MAG: DUF1641 domain-containing protein [Planctomycetota bacterium]
MASNDSPEANNGHATALDELKRQLDDPAQVELLRDIFAKLDVVQLSLTALDGALRRAETLTDNVADSVGDVRGVVDPTTVSALGRLASLTPALVDGLEKIAPALESDALAKLGDPELVEGLANLADQTPLLLFAAEAANGFMARAETIADNVGESIHEVRGIAETGAGPAVEMLGQLTRLLPAVQTLLEQVEPLVESGSFEALVQSKILDPEMVDTVARVGDALHATRVQQKAEPTQLGTFGMLRALRDPDAQRAMGFFATFLKEFGKQMR